MVGTGKSNSPLVSRLAILTSPDQSLSCILQSVFQVAPLNLEQWMAVFKFSIPVILLDEFLKFCSRQSSSQGMHQLIHCKYRTSLSHVVLSSVEVKSKED